jgi:pyruvate dehydrogenase E2 component (dihydrolipoamide acetyltransferase)
MPTLRIPSPIPGLQATALTLSRWAKASGQAFAKGDLLVELESETSLVHLEASEAGALGRILVPAGKTVPLGTELAEYTAGAAAATAPQAQQPSPQVVQKSVNTMPSSSPAGQVTPILMPQAGNTMEEGRMVAWKVKVGDRVAVGQVICEIETDKATVEFESTDAGRLARIVADVGAVVPVKQPIAYLAENDADVDAILGSGGTPAAAAAPAQAMPAAAQSAAPSGNVTPILMPQAGNTMEEGRVVAWKVKEGDRITVGQIICEIETDKATVEFEATDAGRLAKIIAPAGAVVPVKQPVAFLAENDADVQAYLSAGGASAAPVAPAASQPAVAQPKAAGTAAATGAPTAALPGGRVKASPAARKIAATMGVDLGSVGAGSGPQGRILSTDLNRATPVRTPPPSAPVVPAAPGTVVRKPMSKMRRAIAVNLQTSKQTIPHFYLTLTINADPLFAFYRAQKPATGCTINDVILLAVGKTIAEFPAFRSRLEGNDIVEMPNANVGVAVTIDEGLVVPVVMAIENHTLSTLPAETKRVVENARKGKLENIGKGVFTISNMGMLGVESFGAIINPPESGILAIAAVRESVVVKDGAFRAAKVMTMTLSVDHRVVDGAMAAGFMNKLKERLENPQ